jgi:hypothetical protein
MPHTQPERIEGARAAGPDLFVGQIPQLQDWPGSIAAPDPYFVLFVAADSAEVADHDLKRSLGRSSSRVRHA